MDPIEKARKRMEHWMSHNEHHQEEYEAFAAELDAAGQARSAGSIREMAALAAQSNACLRKALAALKKREPV